MKDVLAPEKSMPTCYSVDDIGRIMGISQPKAYELAHRKGFPCIRVGSRIVIPAAKFDAWLDEELRRNNA
ncbi:hypothetical protein AGMMS49992_07490 [Clostridia bacterium]|nr:hypothetical protein AGMMS49992_07490 [Clostridia bacterium]